MNKTKIIRDEGLDKFYTVPEYSKKCIEKVFNIYNEVKWDLILEPSVGNGSFFNQISNSYFKIGVDISPEVQSEKNNIITQNFLEYKPDSHFKKILCIGNPPFGKNSSLAIKFFNHSSQWSDVIAFIIPRTFRKISVQNRLNKYFHLVYDEEIPVKPCHFTPSMSVKCCFQIWEKRKNERTKIMLPIEHKDWSFLKFGEKDIYGQPTPPKDADFAIRAYGGKIGDIVTENLELLRPKSWHWIKCNIDKFILIDRMKKLNYYNSNNTARQNSMGKSELVKLYSDYLHKMSLN